MALKRKNINNAFTLNATAMLLCFVLQFSALNVSAQEEKTAAIKLSFAQTDSSRTVKATVLASDSSPVKATDIHLYVKRMYSLLAVGKVVATDDNGEAEISFPMDLPGDKNGMLTVIAKIEKDEVYGNAEAQSDVKWGVTPTNESYNWGNRSLSASREKAPMFLVIASIAIILGIWGTILYLIFQLFRIRQAGKTMKKIPVTAG